MKKSVIALTFGLMLSGFNYVSAQRCSTTEYYEMRKQSDPSIQIRMDHAEKIIQDWINNKTVTLPSIPGYVPTGNRQKDVAAYANAKRNLVIAKPAVQQAATPGNIEKARREKRKNNEFIYRKGGAQ